MTMCEKLGLDSEVRELRLGKSFDKKNPVAYHSIRYDFKPASVDKNQVANVDIGEGNSVTVTVPHVEGAGTTHTVYKGNKRTCQKECVLVIDHQTGEITLEKLASNIHLKKTRQEGSSRAGLQPLQQRPHTPTEVKKELKSSPPKKKKTTPPISNLSLSQSSTTDTHQVAVKREPLVKPAKADIDLMSSSSSSSSSDSDSDNDTSNKRQSAAPPPPQSAAATAAMAAATKGDFRSMLSMDLQLSESDSDSD